MNRLLLAFIATLSLHSAIAQSGYRLDFKITGLRDTVVNLGYYLSEQSYRKDTAQVDANGSFTFQGDKSLPQGVYFLVLKNSLQFQFVLGEDQHFSMTTDRADYIKNMKVTGDPDNEGYFENLNYSAARYREAEPFVKVLRDSMATADAKKVAQDNYKRIFDQVITRQNELMAKHPTWVSSRWLQATRQIEVPEAPKDSNGKVDSTFQYRYYRAHYFDYFDLSDEALLRLPKPLYAEKLKEYLDKLVPPHPDSIFREVNNLVKKAKKNPDTYKWCVWTCLTHYGNHRIMGLDEVYVRLYDAYVANGEMDFWLDKNMKQTVKEYVDKVRLSLIGNTGPNLTMQDASLKPRSLYDIKSTYTILYFFRPTCGHCREETPKLVEFYNRNKKRFDLEVFAVNTDSSLADMKKFIAEMNVPWITVSGPRSYVGPFSKFYHADLTPTIYILDNRKKIIAKKIDIGQFEDFLARHSKMNSKI